MRGGGHQPAPRGLADRSRRLRPLLRNQVLDEHPYGVIGQQQVAVFVGGPTRCAAHPRLADASLYSSISNCRSASR
jgi:hypothetical protein